MAWLVKGYDDEPIRYGGAFGHWSFSTEDNYYDDLATVPKAVTSLSLRRSDKNWGALSSLDHLEEVSADSVSKKQLQIVFALKSLKRLRLSEMRQVDLTCVEQLVNLEELALFNVSGPKSLSSVAALPCLKSLLIQNMRSLEDWSALGALTQLRCLCICGGFVEKLPKVQSLAFLGKLQELRHLHISSIRCLDGWPVFEGLSKCKNIETVHVNPHYFTLDDHAYLDAVVPEEKRLFKGLYSVQTNCRKVAVTLSEVKDLPGEELFFEPRVKWQKGQPFTRGGWEARDKAIEHAEAFEARYHEVKSRVLESRK